MELGIWIIEGLISIAAAFLLGYIVIWFVTQFNKDK